jgi:hypothetical protein
VPLFSLLSAIAPAIDAVVDTTRRSTQCSRRPNREDRRLYYPPGMARQGRQNSKLQDAKCKLKVGVSRVVLDAGYCDFEDSLRLLQIDHPTLSCQTALNSVRCSYSFSSLIEPGRQFIFAGQALIV